MHANSRPATAAELVDDQIELFSLPEVCLRIQELADDPEADIREFGELVAQDPALTARLLKLVNSAYFGFPSRIDTVSRAIGLVGIEELRSLALASAAVEVFQDAGGRLDMFSFWRHSIFCGLVARSLARDARVLHAERLFVLGVLHDLGRLLIFSRLPEAGAAVVEEAGHCLCDLPAAERGLLGFDHAEAGAELLARWGLPVVMQEAVHHHHRPAAATASHGLEAALLEIANAATHEIERQGEPTAYDPFGAFLTPAPLDSGAGTPCLDRVPESSWTLARVGRDQINPALRTAADAFDDVLAILYGV